MRTFALILVLILGVSLGYLLRPATTKHANVALAPPRAEVSDYLATPVSPTLHGRRVARRIWGPVCDGQVAIVFRPLPGKQSGRANWLYDPLRPDAVRRRSNCVITLDVRAWKRHTMCGTIVHEWGHLAGREHTANPRSIMFPVMREGRNVPRSCR